MGPAHLMQFHDSPIPGRGQRRETSHLSFRPSDVPRSQVQHVCVHFAKFDCYCCSCRAQHISIYIYIYIIWYAVICVFFRLLFSLFPFLESWQDLRRVFFQKRQTRWDLVGDPASPGPGDWAIRRGWGSKTGWQNVVGSVSKLKF